MKLEIKNKKNNPLMERKDVEAVADHGKSPTPDKATVQKLVANKIKVKPTKVEIRKILSYEGMQKIRIISKVWNKEKVEDLTKKQEKAKSSEKEGKQSEEKKSEEKEDKGTGEKGSEGPSEEKEPGTKKETKSKQGGKEQRKEQKTPQKESAEKGK